MASAQIRTLPGLMLNCHMSLSLLKMTEGPRRLTHGLPLSDSGTIPSFPHALRILDLMRVFG